MVKAVVKETAVAGRTLLVEKPVEVPALVEKFAKKFIEKPVEPVEPVDST